MDRINIFWVRRDLRLHDNHGLYVALRSGIPVLPIFIFDRNILDELEVRDARVQFIYDEIQKLKSELVKKGSDIKVFYGFPIDIWRQLIEDYKIEEVYTNHDYEPYALKRDGEVEDFLKSQGIKFDTFKDHVVFEKKEILTKAGSVYTVFTPYKNAWLEKFRREYGDFIGKGKSIFPSEDHQDRYHKIEKSKGPSLEDMGFEKCDIEIPAQSVARKIVKNYARSRDFPADESGTSRLGIHFRFGTISIRKKALSAYGLSETFLSELIWRDFYAQILANFPNVVTESFRAKYDKIPWRNDPDEWEAWKTGKTGYPMVDAGMCQLNVTGYMHNRVRMITASFLTKHLLIDWRWGEAYFAKKLLDYDLASNNGGWQWAAGSGTDAAPYFRIFNPESQMKKFDPEWRYIRKWIPEYGSDLYPDPIVDHKYARERCLLVYKKALNS